jgi:hypothetical protein
VHIHPTVSEFIPVMIGNLKDLQPRNAER